MAGLTDPVYVGSTESLMAGSTDSVSAGPHCNQDVGVEPKHLFNLSPCTQRGLALGDVHTAKLTVPTICYIRNGPSQTRLHFCERLFVHSMILDEYPVADGKCSELNLHVVVLQVALQLLNAYAQICTLAAVWLAVPRHRHRRP